MKDENCEQTLDAIDEGRSVSVLEEKIHLGGENTREKSGHLLMWVKRILPNLGF